MLDSTCAGEVTEIARTTVGAHARALEDMAGWYRAVCQDHRYLQTAT